jgi:hypothetical protein
MKENIAHDFSIFIAANYGTLKTSNFARPLKNRTPAA